MKTKVFLVSLIMIFAINSGAFTISAQTISFAEKLQVLLEKNDIEDIKAKKDALQEKAMALATKVYENIQKQENQNNETTETDASNESKKDDVSDAEYEEK